MTGFAKAHHLYVHNGKKQFSLSVDSYNSKLINYQYTTTKDCIGLLLLRPVRCSQLIEYPLNANGCLTQAATLPEIYT